MSLGEQHLEVNLGQLNELIARNNDVCADLQSAVAKADDERRKLQRDACSVFGLEYVIEHWTSIETLRGLDQKLTELQQQLAELEKSGPSKHAKDRVAETFVLLLKEFFGDKYVFDKASFALKRGDKEMTRGPHRTLSDGEKTAIAFCYFIAAIHRRVTANSDYEKLFLVFDDPVTSMSYDYVFAIAQTLKHLNISKQGEISVNPSKIDGNKSSRPNLLVLTHSSYFFNVARANAVIKPEATFALSNNGTKHSITRMGQYVSPFEQQLEHVYRIAQGTEPDHSTGNCIRSVIEAVGRFCRPDKTPSVQEFITFLAGEDGIPIKSTLINSMCHGTYYDETPTADDITLACKEAIVVVRRYAPGHLEILKKADKAKES
jgi:wobble nucleotide-excising tRNase